MSQAFEYIQENNNNEYSSNPLREEAIDLLAGPSVASNSADQLELDLDGPIYKEEISKSEPILLGRRSYAETMSGKQGNQYRDTRDKDHSIGKTMLESNANPDLLMDTYEEATHEQCKNPLLKKVFHYGKDVTALTVGGGLTGTAVGVGPWGTAIGGGAGAIAGVVKASNKLKSDYLECKSNIYKATIDSMVDYKDERKRRW